MAPAERCFYVASVGEFLAEPTSTIVGALAQGQAALHLAVEPSDVTAWQISVSLLQAAFAKLEPSTHAWFIVLEYSMFRAGRRIDAVVLAPRLVIVIEMKVGEHFYRSADRLQVEDYALKLRDFHNYSQRRTIVPILCATEADTQPWTPTLVEGVLSTCLASASTLADMIRACLAAAGEGEQGVDVDAFLWSAYSPTPALVEAARELYLGHKIEELGRGGAADAALRSAADRLAAAVGEARAGRQHVVCFVSGAPGAGKTLLGLDLALSSLASDDSPSALLSGNRPLVHVLVEALASDAAARKPSLTKAEARHRAGSSIQTLLGYLKEHLGAAVPPEHVIIFDEAQRAWDAETGQRLMGRRSSEPSLFLEILELLDWACLVCLVGPGQEINRGEGGLPLWGEALGDGSRHRNWRVVAPAEAIEGGPEVAGPGVAHAWRPQPGQWTAAPELHLSNDLRSYRNEAHGPWVAALLDGDLVGAAAAACREDGPPAFLTRNLAQAREWLRERQRGLRVDGHEIFPVGGQGSPHWRPRKLPACGHQISPSPVR